MAAIATSLSVLPLENVVMGGRNPTPPPNASPVGVAHTVRP
jgi:hypothetical protein